MTAPATVSATAEDLKRSGWSMVEATGFISHVGPLWQRTVDGAYEYALLTEDKHHNRRGVVQGGVVMTIADRTCGMTARYVTGQPAMVTVQFDTQFIDAAKIGELMISRPRVVRATRSLIFMQTEVSAAERIVATASGVFRIFNERTTASA
ncbi:MAG: PaaI family thioesterase [Proteobacteria bacterium]|nr:PaaI family thioesterase [Pseudomonadota bacterium]